MLIYKIYLVPGIEKRQLWVHVWMVETQFCKQAAWYIIHVRKICFLWTKHTIWLLLLSFTQNIVRACSMLYHEGYRSVTPLDAARVNRRVFHNHSVHWYCINLKKGRDYVKYDMYRLATAGSVVSAPRTSPCRLGVPQCNSSFVIARGSANPSAFGLPVHLSRAH